MKFLYFLLGLVHAATAIDIRFSGEPNCKGWSVACSNWSPNDCCYVPNEGYFKHIGFGPVPGDWHITMWGHIEYGCTGARTGGNSDIFQNGLKDYCFDSPGPTLDLRSGNYWFLEQKQKRKDPEDSEIPVAPATAQACQLVDTLILEDGTKYVLRGLDKDVISKAIEAAFNGTVRAAIEKFQLSLL